MFSLQSSIFCVIIGCIPSHSLFFLEDETFNVSIYLRVMLRLFLDTKAALGHNDFTGVIARNYFLFAHSVWYHPVVNYGALMLKALFEYWPNSETMKAKQRILDEQKLQEQGKRRAWI